MSCKQIIISDAAQAESLIGRAMLKRATAMTNSNNQSRCMENRLALLFYGYEAKFLD